MIMDDNKIMEAAKLIANSSAALIEAMGMMSENIIDTSAIKYCFLALSKESLVSMINPIVKSMHRLFVKSLDDLL